MEQRQLRGLLERVATGQASIEEAERALRVAPFEDLGYAKVDTHRGVRQGVSEVVYGAGKTAEQIAGVCRALLEGGQHRVLVTRLEADKAERVERLLVGQGVALCSGEDGAFSDGGAPGRLGPACLRVPHTAASWHPGRSSRARRQRNRRRGGGGNERSAGCRGGCSNCGDARQRRGASLRRGRCWHPSAARSCRRHCGGKRGRGRRWHGRGAGTDGPLLATKNCSHAMREQFSFQKAMTQSQWAAGALFVCSGRRG